MKKTSYVIIGFPRTGTTAVHLALKGHPAISAFTGELRIDPFFTKGISAFTWGRDPIEEKGRGFTVLFEALASMSANSKTTTLGAKTVCSSPIQAHALLDTLQKHLTDVKIILMIRHDLVAQYGSWITALRSDVWHSWYNGAKDRQIPPLTINKWLFIRYLLNCLDTYAVLQKIQETHNVIECHYEDLLKDSDAVYAQLFDFLNVSQETVTWLNSEKVLPAPEKYIRNYSEMKLLLEHMRTKYFQGSIPPRTVGLAKLYARIYRRVNPKHVIL